MFFNCTEDEAQAHYMLGKCSAMEPDPQPQEQFLNPSFLQLMDLSF